ncbi:MAG: hypothetical protein EOO39_02265 [Cytophagaceae bacterium]|nr:MAG: hypothetical protein EOO39_02265 [Cytophagaceae bacterium]
MTGLTEKELLIAIERVTANIEDEKRQSELRLAPQREDLNRFIGLYSEAYSPLKPGDKVKYTPYGAKHQGVIRIERARCLIFPDKWEYDVVVESIDHPSQQAHVGKKVTFIIWRDETPTKIK